MREVFLIFFFLTFASFEACAPAESKTDIEITSFAANGAHSEIKILVTSSRSDISGLGVGRLLLDAGELILPAGKLIELINPKWACDKL